MSELSNYPVFSACITTKNRLPDLAIKNGQLIFIKDQQKVAFDYNDNRIIYNQIEELATEQDRLSILAPVAGLFYFVVETAVLWTYQNDWIQITTVRDDISMMVDEVIQDKIDNGELGSFGVVSATDDDNGNVTLTVVGFSVLDDNAGNITIS